MKEAKIQNKMLKYIILELTHFKFDENLENYEPFLIKLNSEPNLKRNIIYLSNKDLVELSYADDEIYDVEITADGLSYLYEEKQKKLTVIKNWTINIATAVMSGLIGAAFAYWLTTF